MQTLICLICFVDAHKSSSNSAMFTIDDVDSLITSHAVKKEVTLTPSTPTPVTTHSKYIGHKRKKTVEPEDDFANTENHFHEMIS